MRLYTPSNVGDPTFGDDIPFAKQMMRDKMPLLNAKYIEHVNILGYHIAVLRFHGATQAR